jgi:hypothetical protein
VQGDARKAQTPAYPRRGSRAECRSQSLSALCAARPLQSASATRPEEAGGRYATTLRNDQALHLGTIPPYSGAPPPEKRRSPNDKNRRGTIDDGSSRPRLNDAPREHRESYDYCDRRKSVPKCVHEDALSNAAPRRRQRPPKQPPYRVIKRRLAVEPAACSRLEKGDVTRNVTLPRVQPQNTIPIPLRPYVRP